MGRLTQLVTETYKKYLPLAEQSSIEFNLDIIDPSGEVSGDIVTMLDEHLPAALSRSSKGKVSITVKNGKIMIKDNGTILSKPACALLSHGRVEAKSRLGFGTTVTIDLKSNHSPEKA